MPLCSAGTVCAIVRNAFWHTVTWRVRFNAVELGYGVWVNRLTSYRYPQLEAVGCDGEGPWRQHPRVVDEHVQRGGGRQQRVSQRLDGPGGMVR